MPTIRFASLLLTLVFCTALYGDRDTPFWPQWGANPQHTGMVDVTAQKLKEIKADIIYDPFIEQEKAEEVVVFGQPVLTVHEQVPLTDGDDVYMETKTGTYNSCNPAGAWFTQGAACGPNTWNTIIWNETKFSWRDGKLEKMWSYATDWKPEPNGFLLVGWEPVFHAAEANGFIYVPGAGGSVWKVDKRSGEAISHIEPLNGISQIAANTFVSSPLSADEDGNIYYNAIELADPSLGDPWFQNDVQGAWLVKVTPSGASSSVPYATLLPNAPEGFAQTCPGTFYDLDPGDGSTLPWPPVGFVGTNQVPPPIICGSQRPPLNVAPAIGRDGTIFTASFAHFNEMQSYLVAINSKDLTTKWASSLQNLFHDGCGVTLLIAAPGVTNQPQSCRNRATPGVDPTTNAPGSGIIFDTTSSSPTVLPDGSVLFGVNGEYNQGHLMKFDARGNFLGSYTFGFDETPAVYRHDDTYSIVIKDNRAGPYYCLGFNNPVCTFPVTGPFYITQLDSRMNVEWHFQSTNTESCTRQPDGTLQCVSDHPNGFEWCVNMIAVDKHGHVYANSEDGNVYEVPQGQHGVFTEPTGRLFLNAAFGAAYTPLSIGPDGKISTQNNGHLFVVGH